MILKRGNITFLEGYFISKSGRLWSRYDKSGHLTKDSWHRVKYNTSKGGYKLTKIQRRLIKQRHKEGCRICDLAKEFKVSRITIRRIIDQKLRSYNRKDNILYLSI